MITMTVKIVNSIAATYSYDSDPNHTLQKIQQFLR